MNRSLCALFSCLLVLKLQYCNAATYYVSTGGKTSAVIILMINDSTGYKTLTMYFYRIKHKDLKKKHVSTNTSCQFLLCYVVLLLEIWSLFKHLLLHYQSQIQILIMWLQLSSSDSDNAGHSSRLRKLMNKRWWDGVMLLV